MSLRKRLLISTGVAVLVGLLVVDTLTYVLVTRSQLEQIDESLQRAHRPIEDLAEGDPSGWRDIGDVAPGLYVAIVDGSGRVLFDTPAREPGRRSVSVDLAQIDFDRRSQTVAASNGDNFRVRVDPLPRGGAVIFGETLHELDEARQGLLVALLAASAAALAAILGLAWWLIGVGLQPLTRVRQSAASITDADLAEVRVPGDDQPTEVGELARSLNSMLDRLDTARAERETSIANLQASEARMRQFVADASHELRTPIAATAAYAELFDKGARDHPVDLDRSMKGIQAEAARMAGLVDDLLLLARLDEERPLERRPVDLTELVHAAVDAARAVEPGRSWRLAMTDVLTVDGDQARLRQVVDNLLGNVRTHTPVDCPGEIRLSRTEGLAVLTVSDTGPGVSDDALPKLSNRFYRVDEARARSQGGTGLGLAISQAIVEEHGGTLEIAHNRPTGLAVTVTLPLHAIEA